MPTSRTRAHEVPEVMRRRLRVALRQYRDAAELTQRAAAEALDWSVSKIIRIEQGAVGITPTDLRALLGDDFDIELHATGPRTDPPAGTPHVADVVLRARRRT